MEQACETHMTLKDKLNSNNLKPDRKKKEERLECLTSRAEREREGVEPEPHLRIESPTIMEPAVKDQHNNTQQQSADNYQHSNRLQQIKIQILLAYVYI